MKHKTSELTGALLDAAVAKGSGVAVQVIGDQCLGDRGTAEDYAYVYAPSTDWAQGGPIIERERIALVVMKNFWCAFYPKEQAYEPDYWYFEQTSDHPDGSGPTALIAAMRAYVASRFGEEVDL